MIQKLAIIASLVVSGCATPPPTHTYDQFLHSLPMVERVRVQQEVKDIEDSLPNAEVSGALPPPASDKQKQPDRESVN